MKTVCRNIRKLYARAQWELNLPSEYEKNQRTEPNLLGCSCESSINYSEKWNGNENDTCCSSTESNHYSTENMRRRIIDYDDKKNLQTKNSGIE